MSIFILYNQPGTNNFTRLNIEIMSVNIEKNVASNYHSNWIDMTIYKSCGLRK